MEAGLEVLLRLPPEYRCRSRLLGAPDFVYDTKYLKFVTKFFGNSRGDLHRNALLKKYPDCQGLAFNFFVKMSSWLETFKRAAAVKGNNMFF